MANALLTLGGGKLEIVDQDYDRAKDLARELGQKYGEDRVSAVANKDQALATADGIVNATPMGYSNEITSKAQPAMRSTPSSWPPATTCGCSSRGSPRFCAP